MAYFLRWPADSGTGGGNNKLCQISGIATSGTVNIALKFAENVIDPASVTAKAAYIYDGRRVLNGTTNGGGGYLLEGNANVIESAGVSNFKLNGVTSNNTGWRTAVVDDIYSFTTNGEADGVIAIGARHNAIEHFCLLALKSITITDTNGTHVIDMSDSGGTLNEFTSTDGLLKLKLFNFSGTAHWVFYDAGSAATFAASLQTVSSVIANLPATTAIWDVSTLSSPASLTNTDTRLLKGATGSGAYANARANFPLVGNVYFSAEVSTNSTGAVAGIGVADITLATTDAAVWAGSGNSGAIWGPDGTVYLNGSVAATHTFTNNPQIIEIAVRVNSRKVWMRRSGGSWIGGGDPTLDTTPTFTVPGTGALYPVGSVTVSGSAASRYVDLHGSTVNVQGTPPAGFTVGLITSPNLASTLFSQSSVSANLAAPVYLGASLLNQTEITVNLVKPALSLEASLASVSVVIPNLILPINLAASLTTLSEIVAAITGASLHLNSSLISESAVQANLNTINHFYSSLVGLTTINTNLVLPASLRTSLSSVSTVGSSLVVSTYFNSVLLNQSSISVDLVEGAVPAVFTAVLSANTSINAELVLKKLFECVLYSSSDLLGNLYVESATNPGWASPVVLFPEVASIQEIALTFDQLGRPLVFYRVNEADLYIYWFNPSTSENEIRYIGLGISPVAGFDIIDDTSDPMSDAMLFYVRNDTAYMRIQRESYNIEHDSGVTRENMRLTSSGMRIDNRFQVVYTYTGAPQLVVTPEDPIGTIPENPEPPIDPEDPGLPDNQTPIELDYEYRNVGMHSGSLFVANTIKINGRDSFKLGFEIVNHGSGHKMGGTYGFYVFGADTYDGFSRNLYGSAFINHVNRHIVFLVWRASSSLTYTLRVENKIDLKGIWEFEFVGTRIKLYLNGVLVAEDWFSSEGSFSESGRLTFGGMRQVLRSQSNLPGNIAGSGLSFDGTMRNCWIDHPNFGRVDWPINEYDSPIQHSDPASSHDLTILNHKTTNWIIVPE